MAFENAVIDEKKIEVAPNENAAPVVNEIKPDNTLEIQTGDIKHTVEEKKEFDPNAFVKETFGYDNVETAKQEFEKLKQPKEEPKFKFANETSEKIFNSLKEGREADIYSYLKTKQELSNLDKLSPKDTVKLDIQYKNPELTANEVEFLLNEKYNIPEKPMQDDVETDEEYAKKVASWEKAVARAETKISIDSKLAKKDLQKLNTELVLPEIKSSNVDEAALKEQQSKARINYEQALESDYKKFDGFSVSYKDKDVEIPISYTIPEDEKVATKNDLKEMDVDDFLGNRWFDKEGKPNIQKQMSDKYILNNFDKIIQKVAQDAGAKVKEHYVRTQKNITVGQPAQTGDPNVDSRTPLQVVQEARWKKNGVTA